VAFWSKSARVDGTDVRVEYKDAYDNEKDLIRGTRGRISDEAALTFLKARKDELLRSLAERDRGQGVGYWMTLMGRVQAIHEVIVEISTAQRRKIEAVPEAVPEVVPEDKYEVGLLAPPVPEPGVLWRVRRNLPHSKLTFEVRWTGRAWASQNKRTGSTTYQSATHAWLLGWRIDALDPPFSVWIMEGPDGERRGYIRPVNHLGHAEPAPQVARQDEVEELKARIVDMEKLVSNLRGVTKKGNE